MQRSSALDGFAEVVIDNGKNYSNLGTIWRTAYNLGAAGTGQIGQRYKRQSSDTLDAWRILPHRVYLDSDEWYQTMPYGAQAVAVEITEGATSLYEFEHPKQAVYVFGPEDGSVQPRILEKVQHTIYIPTDHCMNQAVTVGVVLGHRANQIKERNGNDYSN